LPDPGQANLIIFNQGPVQALGFINITTAAFLIDFEIRLRADSEKPLETSEARVKLGA
jgi:hypothetical protein